MVRPSVESQAKIGETPPAPHRFSIEARLREISMFFDGTDRIHQAMRKLADLFEQQKIEYAIVGGMAVNAHRHARTTGDVDFLIRPEGLKQIRDLVTEGVLVADKSRPRRFIEPTTGVQFYVLLTGAFPGG